MSEDLDLYPPEELEEREVMVLAAVSDEYGLEFPSAANVVRELSPLFEENQSTVYGRISTSLSKMVENGYVQDREVCGNDKPFEPTGKGQKILNESNVFEYLETQIQ